MDLNIEDNLKNKEYLDIAGRQTALDIFRFVVFCHIHFIFTLGVIFMFMFVLICKVLFIFEVIFIITVVPLFEVIFICESIAAIRMSPAMLYIVGRRHAMSAHNHTRTRTTTVV